MSKTLYVATCAEVVEVGSLKAAKAYAENQTHDDSVFVYNEDPRTTTARPTVHFYQAPNTKWYRVGGR